MPSTLITKYGSGAPLASDLVRGELAVDTENGRLYTEDSLGAVVEIGLNPGGNLDVTGTVTADGLTVDSSSGITVNGPTNQDGKLNLVAYAGVQNAEARIQAARGNTSGTDSRLQFLTNNGTSLLTRVDINDNGNISFYEDTGTTAKLFWDASAESLGIGTASPGRLLELYGTTNPALRLHNGTDTTDIGIATSAGAIATSSLNGALVIARNGANAINLATNGNVRATIDSSGNVGIGTSNPLKELHIASSQPEIRLEDASGTVNYGDIVYTDGRFIIATDGGNTQASSTIEFQVDGTEAMRIDSAGNVGIGVTPSAWSTLTTLQVKNAHLGGYVDNAYFGANCYYDGSNWRYIATNEASRLELTGGGVQFWPAGSGTAGDVMPQTQAMTLDSAGDLLLGSALKIYGAANRTVLEVSGSNDSLFALNDTQPGSLTNRYYIHNDRANGNINHYCPPGTFKMLWWTNGLRRMTLDDSGNLLVGDSSATFNDTAKTVIRPSSDNWVIKSGVCTSFNRTASDGDFLEFYRGSTLKVGSIGATGGDLFIGTGDVGLWFQDGGNAIRPFRVDTQVGLDNSISLGVATTGRFADAYITNGVTTGSDANDKQDIETLSDAEQRVAVVCKGLLRKWRWKDAVEAKGDEARIHFGIIAQDLKAAFEAEGLDAGRYAMFMSNTWTDEETGEERTRLGVRYHELLAFIIAAI